MAVFLWTPMNQTMYGLVNDGSSYWHKSGMDIVTTALKQVNYRK